MLIRLRKGAASGLNLALRCGVAVVADHSSVPEPPCQHDTAERCWEEASMQILSGVTAAIGHDCTPPGSASRWEARRKPKPPSGKMEATVPMFPGEGCHEASHDDEVSSGTNKWGQRPFVSIAD